MDAGEIEDHPDRGRSRMVRVEADWGTSGLWDDSPQGFDPIEADELPVSVALREQLEAWTSRLEDLRAKSEYPPEWRFGSRADFEAFNTDGADLAARMQAELGAAWQVSYTPFPADPEET